MGKGAVRAIFLGKKKGELLESVDEVQAIAGHGLVGDRHYQADGPRGSRYEAQQELTLIETETFEALDRDLKLSIDPQMARRNILTQGVPLNHLVGVDFFVGDVKVRGLELCEPCGHLQKLTSPEFRQALVHRGGLRAAILNDGTIRVSDAISFES